MRIVIRLACILGLFLLLCLLPGKSRAGDPAAGKPADPPNTANKTADKAPAADEEQPKKLDPAHTKALNEALGGTGVINGKVFTLTLPRTDLDLHNLDFGDIPIEAGIATTLHVWRCNCGKYYIIGSFCLADFESNDVLDSLMKGNMKVASVGPMLMEEKPRLTIIRFQGEGDMPAIIKVMKECYRWIGENRSKPNPIEK